MDDIIEILNYSHFMIFDFSNIHALSNTFLYFFLFMADFLFSLEDEVELLLLYWTDEEDDAAGIFWIFLACYRILWLFFGLRQEFKTNIYRSFKVVRLLWSVEFDGWMWLNYNIFIIWYIAVECYLLYGAARMNWRRRKGGRRTSRNGSTLWGWHFAEICVKLLLGNVSLKYVTKRVVWGVLEVIREK